MATISNLRGLVIATYSKLGEKSPSPRNGTGYHPTFVECLTNRDDMNLGILGERKRESVDFPFELGNLRVEYLTKANELPSTLLLEVWE